jgi:hypothetical protein
MGRGRMLHAYQHMPQVNVVAVAVAVGLFGAKTWQPSARPHETMINNL